MTSRQSRSRALDDLPEDPWSVRRTKQVIREIARLRALRGLSTEALADRCSRFLGSPNAITVASLNSLFAGKRKSLSFTEVEMFASTLSVTVLDLLYPDEEFVEVRPGKQVGSADALADALDMRMALPGGLAVYTGGRVDRVYRALEAARSVEENTASAIQKMRRFNTYDAESSLLRHHFELLRLAVTNLQDLYLPRAFDDTPTSSSLPTLPETVNWALDVDRVSSITPALLTAIEPRFEGWTAGEYQFGSMPPISDDDSGGADNGEHQAEG